MTWFSFIYNFDFVYYIYFIGNGLHIRLNAFVMEMARDFFAHDLTSVRSD